MHALDMPITDPAWMQFVSTRPEATLFHHPAWSQLLAEVYGYVPFVRAFVDDSGTLVAGLPVMEIRSRLTGRRFVSLPFTDYCPPLLGDGAGMEDLARALDQGWNARTRLEVRAALPKQPHVCLRSDALRHTLAVGPDEQAVWASFDKDMQRNIRRGEREGVTATLDRSLEGMAAFYRLQVLTRHRLGVPAQPWRFFEHLHRLVVEPGLGFVLLAHAGDAPLSAAVLLSWNGTLIGKYLASDERSWSMRPNNVLIWEAVRWACRNGYHTLDLGRTDEGEEGLRRFKVGWGTREEPLTYSFFARKAPGPLGKRAQQALSYVIRHSPQSVCCALGELLYVHFG